MLDSGESICQAIFCRLPDQHRRLFILLVWNTILQRCLLKRRQFLSSAFAFSSAGLAAQLPAVAQPAKKAADASRQFYELRKYLLRTGTGSKITAEYVAKALIPALNRLGIAPVGAFNLEIGPDMPALYLLLPSNDSATLLTAGSQLLGDKDYLAAAESFWNAPESSPAFVRIESELMQAFEGWPRLVIPPAAALPGKRVFQLRSYESASMQDHLRKIEMFHSGEFEIFRKAGFADVFFADVLIGPRLPKLTYMVSVEDLDKLEERWDAFFSDPQWKELAGRPRFSFEPTVSNVSNLVLSRAAYSQI